MILLGFASFGFSQGFGPVQQENKGLNFANLESAQKAATIKKLIISGCQSVDETLVKTNFLLKEGEIYSPGKVSESIKSLYGLGLFSDIKVKVDQLPDGLNVYIEVAEFDLLDKIIYKGNKKLDEEDLNEAVNLIEGQVLPPQVLKESKNNIIKKYKEEGYFLVSVTIEQTPNEQNGKTSIEFTIDEGKKVQVEKITFEGVAAFKEGKLKRQFENIKEDRWWRSGDFDEEKFEEDLATLTAFYHNKGYLDARVESHELEYSDDKEDMFLKIKIHEGVKFILGKVTFIGNEVYSDTILSRAMEIKEKEVLAADLLERSKFTMESLYREKGYLFVRFDEKRTYSDSVVDLTFQVTEGQPAYVHKVIINGNVKTLEKVIRREIKTLPGNVYQQSRLQRTVRDIQMLQYFDDVKFDLENREDGWINLKFDVVPKETGTDQFTAGMGFSQRQGVVGNLGLTINNFSIRKPFLEGGGQLLRINFEHGEFRQNRDITFQEPWFMDTRTLLGFRIFWTKNKFFRSSEAEQLRKGFELRLGRRLKWPDDYFRIDGQYSFESESTGDFIYIQGRGLIDAKDPAVANNSGLVLAGLKSSLNISLSRNDLDLPTFPTYGSDYSYNLRLVGGPLGGDFKFIRHLIKINWYFPLIWKFVLGSKHKFGLIEKWPGLDFGVSPYDPWLAGGVNYAGQIRGYREAAFGGRLSNGRFMMTTTEEITFPIVDKILYANTFYDLGNVWGRSLDMDFNNLFSGAGFGVRIMVPMFGLLGFDFGYGFQSDDESLSYQQTTRDPSPWEFHFTVGQGF